MSELQGRQRMEARFGPLGSGAGEMAINGAPYDLGGLLAQLGIAFDDLKPIDVQAVEDHYVIRYFDAQDARVVAYEFDAGFRRLAESRAHIAEWMGEEFYFSFYGGH